MKYANGGFYEGNWLDNKYDGDGYMTFGKGSSYDG